MLAGAKFNFWRFLVLLSLVFLYNEALLADGLVGWLSTHENNPRIRHLNSIIGTRPSISAQQSSVIQLPYPHLRRTYQIHLRNSEGKTVLKFNWNPTTSDHLLNLSSDPSQVEEGTNLLMRLYESNRFWSNATLPETERNRFRSLISHALREQTLARASFQNTQNSRNEIWLMPIGEPIEFLAGSSGNVNGRIRRLAGGNESFLNNRTRVLSVGFSPFVGGLLFRNQMGHHLVISRETVRFGENNGTRYVTLVPSSNPVFSINSTSNSLNLDSSMTLAVLNAWAQDEAGLHFFRQAEAVLRAAYPNNPDVSLRIPSDWRTLIVRVLGPLNCADLVATAQMPPPT